MQIVRRSVQYQVVKPFKFRTRVIKAGRTVMFNPEKAKLYVASGQLIELSKIRTVDILKSGFRFPETITINGSGPNGKPYYKYIEGFIVSLNGAIATPVPTTLWGAFDSTLCDERWFQDAASKLIRPGRTFKLADIGKAEYPIPVFEFKRIGKRYPIFGVGFDYKNPIMNNEVEQIHQGKYFGNVTICGLFIQIAHWLGARRIFLNGIDMFGKEYFDRTRNKSGHIKDGKVWPHCKRLKILINYLRSKGTETYSFSETQLDVPIRRNYDDA